MGYQSKTYSLSDEVVEAIEAARAKGAASYHEIASCGQSFILLDSESSRSGQTTYFHTEAVTM